MTADSESTFPPGHARTVVDRLHARFRACSDPDLRERPEGWTVREILGHLVDSVANNHLRVSRYIPGGNLAFPAYDQNEWVERAGYGSFDYDTLLTLWYGYNLLFLHMIGRIPPDHLRSSSVTVGGNPPLTLGALIADYYDHMERHERQVRRILGE